MVGMIDGARAYLQSCDAALSGALASASPAQAVDAKRRMDTVEAIRMELTDIESRRSPLDHDFYGLPQRQDLRLVGICAAVLLAALAIYHFADAELIANALFGAVGLIVLVRVALMGIRSWRRAQVSKRVAELRFRWMEAVGAADNFRALQRRLRELEYVHRDRGTGDDSWRDRMWRCEQMVELDIMETRRRIVQRTGIRVDYWPRFDLPRAFASAK